MPVTIDHKELQDALEEFNIRPADYYLSFDTNVLYLVWCTNGANAVRLVHNNGCIDIEIKGVWHEEIPEGYILPSYACVRYILAGAVLGIDITSPNTTQHGYPHRTDR